MLLHSTIYSLSSSPPLRQLSCRSILDSNVFGITLLPFTDYFVYIVSDVSVLGWNAKPESLSAVKQLIENHRDVLNLADDPEVRNAAVDDLISYLEKNPLKYCVLVVDAEKIKSVREERGVDYVRLLQTAERNVGKMFSLN